MTLEDIKRLKDSVYEIEGLLELAQMREDKIDDLAPLIEARIAALKSSVSAEEAAVTIGTASEEMAEVAEVTIEEAVEQRVEEAAAREIEMRENQRIKETAAMVVEKEEDQIKEETTPEEPKKVEAPVVTLTELFEENETTSVTPVTPGEMGSLSEAGRKPLDSSRQSREPRRKPAFCLNDRFRFRRELFNNSDSEFSIAMNKIAAMENYEEAEEHFIEELGWDPDNQEVADFMEIIKIYFEG